MSQPRKSDLDLVQDALRTAYTEAYQPKVIEEALLSAEHAEQPAQAIPMRLPTAHCRVSQPTSFRTHILKLDTPDSSRGGCFPKSPIRLKADRSGSHAPKDAIAPFEAASPRRGTVTHSLPLSVELENHDGDGLLMALTDASPELPESAQWYAWRKTQQMLAGSDGDRAQDLLDNIIENSSVLHPGSYQNEIHHSIQSCKISERLQKVESVNRHHTNPPSKKFIDRNIVDELDTQTWSHPLETITPPGMRIDRAQATREHCWKQPSEKDIQHTDRESVLCQASYLPFPDSTGSSRHDQDSDHPMQLELCTKEFEPTAPYDTQYYSPSSTTSTPSHLTPGNHSPIKQSFHHFSYGSDVRQSIEPETPPQQRIRESTPAYENRSPSPSPVSFDGNAPPYLDLDTDMLDVQNNHNFRTARSSSVPPDILRQGTMLPPPSPCKSLGGSPLAMAYDSASPSMLRSPAIARVRNQSQSPHRQTQYPIRSRSPSPCPSTIHHFQHRPSALSLDSHSSTGDEADAKSRMSAVTNRCPTPAFINVLSATPLQFPVPPPIPPDDHIPKLKLAKRNTRRKSTVQDPSTKIAKTTRSVTTGVLGSRADPGAGRGNTGVTATGSRVKRIGTLVGKLIVVQGLSEALLRAEGGVASRTVPVDVADGESPDRKAAADGQGRSVRRSTRLQRNK